MNVEKILISVWYGSIIQLNKLVFGEEKRCWERVREKVKNYLRVSNLIHIKWEELYMKTKHVLLSLFIVAICVLCTACGSSSKADGIWYSVEDAVEYNFNDGTIFVSGLGIGEYRCKNDMVELSILDEMSDEVLYLMEIEGVEVLTDSNSGMGKVIFCRDKAFAQNAE